MPTVILALTWQWMYDPFYGIVNHYLYKLGLIHNANTIWVGHPNSNIWPLIVVSIWRGFPFMALMLLSGMQGGLFPSRPALGLLPRQGLPVQDDPS